MRTFRAVLTLNGLLESPSWLKQDLAYARSVAKHQLKTHIHVTQTEADPNIVDAGSADKGKAKREDESEASSIAEVDVLNGRPDLPRIVHEACQSSAGSIAFVGMTTLPLSLSMVLMDYW